MRSGGCAGVRISAWVTPAVSALALGVGACQGGGAKLADHAVADASTGGSDSSGPQAQCLDDGQCGAVACGSRCVGGKCVGGQVCTNPDVGHCTVSCTTGAGAPACTVAARDGDQDGHGDARCEAAPGDDCNDDSPIVFASAPELCDGLDNDCDGLVDSFDNLPLGGTVNTLAAPSQSGSMAVFATPQGYAVEQLVRSSSTAAPGANVQILNPSGAVQVTKAVSPNQLWEIDTVAAQDADQLLILGASDVYAVQRVSSTTGDTGGVLPVPFGDAGTLIASVTRSLQGGWIAVRAANGGVYSALPRGLYYSPVSPVGSVGSAVLFGAIPSSVGALSLATGTTNYAATWVDYTPAAGLVPATLRWTVFGPSTTSPSLPAIDTIYTTNTRMIRPQVVATGDGYAIGWFDSSTQLNVSRFKADGTPLCGPVQIAQVASWGNDYSMIADGTGVLAAVVNSAGQATLVRIDDHCTATDTRPVLNRAGTVVASGASLPPVGQPGLTRAADGHVACTWVEQDKAADGGTQYRFTVRVMGSRLCE